MSTEIYDACDKIIAASLNGVWQGILLTLLVALGLRLLGPTNAATRHAVWFSTLLICVLLLPAHLIYELMAGRHETRQSHQQPSQPVRPAFNLAQWLTPSAKPEKSDGAQSEHAESSSSSRTASAEESHFVVIDRVLTGPGKTSSHEQTEGLVLSQAEPVSKTEASEPPDAPPSASASSGWLLRPARWDLRSTIAMPATASLYVVAVWLVLASLRLGILFRRLGQLLCIKRASAEAQGPVSALFERLCEELRIRRRVALRLVPADHAPVLLGFVRPAILLPAHESLLEAPGDVEQILRHELAHVRRRDDWANLLQNTFQAALFFHPVVPWIARRLSLEREVACDDQVLQQIGKPKAYAMLLANLADRFQGNRALPAPGVSTSVSQLKERITMILNTRRNTSPTLARTRLGLITSTVALLAALAVYLGPRVVLAQSDDDVTVSADVNVNVDEAATEVAEVSVTPAVADVVVVDAVPHVENVDVNVSADVVAIPGAPPAALVVSTTPRAENPSDDTEDGPKFKPGDAPHPPMAGAMPVPAPPARIGGHAMAGQPRTPAYADAPDFPVKERSRSIEDRLDRVERMLNELMGRRRSPQPPGGFTFSGPGPTPNPGHDVRIQQQDAQIMTQLQDSRRQQDKAKWEAKMAERNWDIAKSENMRGKKQQKEAFARELEILNHTRETLEKEVEKVQEQIEKLEQQKEKQEQEAQEQKEKRENLEHDKAKKPQEENAK